MNRGKWREKGKGYLLFWLLAAALLGVGHIGIHLQHRNQLEHTAG